MSKPNIVVVGAGIGGITTAARLAQAGCRVTVVEKCDRVGGRCGMIERDGHRFDTGPTLYLIPKLYEDAFAALGERIEDHLDLRRIDPSYQIHFGDGSKLTPTSDLVDMRNQLEAIEPGSFAGFLRYLSEAYAHHNQSQKYLVRRNFTSWRSFLTPRNLYLLLRLRALRRHQTYIGRYFKDPRLKLAFTFQNLYMGLDPYEAPAIFSLLQYTEFAEGVWYPMGGMNAVVEALHKIAETHGVNFMLNTPVERIEVNCRSATGVTLAGGRQLPADIVIANADLPYVYSHLLPDRKLGERLENREHGCSGLLFFWGVDKRYPQLGLHNLFIAEDIRSGFEAMFAPGTVPENPHFYVHAPAYTDPSIAPEGQESLSVALPLAHLSDDAPLDWEIVAEKMRSAVLQRLAGVGIEDLEAHIKFEKLLTPKDWRTQLNLTKGSTHGLSHDLFQMGYMRPHNKHDEYNNLYFVGASTHPGTGMPTVLVSADLVVRRIADEHNIAAAIQAG
ncbi:MAG: phytoene desaturase family protein [Anaerolineales bacterium]|jgi:phytoene desaturase